MEQITVRKINNLTTQVETILHDYPYTRDSDIELWCKVCEMYYPPFNRPVMNYRDLASLLRSLPTLDHLARSRRKVIQKHEYKKYLPNSWFVAAARSMNEQVWLAYARQKDLPTNMNEQTAQIQAKNAHEDNLPSELNPSERLRLDI